MKTKRIFILATFLFSFSSLFSQAPTLKEKDPDADKFIGSWNYKTSEMEFSMTLRKDIQNLGNFKMEVLTGSWKIKNEHGERWVGQKHTIMCGTKQNVNKLEGVLATESTGTFYYFTLEMTDTIGMEARWTVTKTRNNRAVDEMRELYPPPTTCVMEKQLILLPPPTRPGNSDDETSVIL